jgi:DNA-binding MarR family transcriptional regulator
MQNKKIPREKLVEEINNTGRKMSMVTVIFHQSVAEKAGLSAGDHKYLDLLIQEGSMTAGRLAEKTGLTTGAVTGIIDRLEKQGMVKRERNPSDRRQVLVVPIIENAHKRIGPVFEPLLKDFDNFYKKFSDDELVLILKYLQASVEFFQTKIDEFRHENNESGM